METVVNNSAEIQQAALAVGVTAGVIVFLLGAIVGCLLEQKLNFWKW